MSDPQRYSLTIEPDDSAYMELDPDGRYVLWEDVEAAIRPESAGTGLDVTIEALPSYGQWWDEMKEDGSGDWYKGDDIRALVARLSSSDTER